MTSTTPELQEVLIRTDYWAKPIPTREFDWSAWRDDDCFCPDCQPKVGHGSTREEAIADLIEQVWEDFSIEGFCAMMDGEFHQIKGKK